MDNLTKAEIINKLGTLMLANAELSANVAILAQVVRQRDTTIADLKAQIVAISGERTLPSRPRLHCARTCRRTPTEIPAGRIDSSVEFSRN